MNTKLDIPCQHIPLAGRIVGLCRLGGGIGTQRLVAEKSTGDYSFFHCCLYQSKTKGMGD